MQVQRYVSPDLTHFVGRNQTTLKAQYGVLKQILETRILRAWEAEGLERTASYTVQVRTGAKLSDNEAYRDSVVCFCDIPIGDLDVHMQKYSRFGLAFAKKYLMEKGATPVMYVPTTARPALPPFRDFYKKRIATTAGCFDEFYKRYQQLAGVFREWEMDSAIPSDAKAKARQFRDLAQFLDIHILSHLKFFDPRKSDSDDENYYLEREWRIKRSVKFALSDVVRIIVPEAFSWNLRHDFPGYHGQVIFADPELVVTEPRKAARILS